MSVTFRELVNKRIMDTSSSLGAMMSFSDYVASSVENILDFASQPATDEAMYANIIFTDLEQYPNGIVGRLSNVQYQEAIADDDATIAIPINDTGDTVIVTGAGVCNAVEDMVSDLKAQSVYVDYVLNGAGEGTSGLISELRARMPGLDTSFIDKYANILRSSGSPIEALKNYIASYRSNEPIVDQFVTLTNASGYQGNAALAAFLMPGQAIVNWVSDLEFNLDSIITFFKRVWDGITNGVKWIAGKLFGNLTTVYAKADDCVVGRMDVPVFQINLGDPAMRESADPKTHLARFLQAVWLANRDKIRQSYADTSAFDWTFFSSDGYAHSAAWQAMDEDLFADQVMKMYKYEDRYSMLEVPIPSSTDEDISWVLQVGSTEDGLGGHPLIVSLYPVCNYQTISNYSDAAISVKIYESLAGAVYHLTSSVPFLAPGHVGDGPVIRSGHEVEDGVNHCRLFTLQMFSDANLDIKQNFAENLKWVDGSYDWSDVFRDRQALGTVTNNDLDRANFVTALLIYGFMYGRGPSMARSSVGADDVYVRLANINYTGTLLYPAPTYTPSGNDHSIPVDATSSDPGLHESFTPYTIYSCMPISVHYQTIDEQAKEIIRVVVVGFAVLIVAVAAIKFAKWRKKRVRLGVLKQAAVDSSSWDYAQNPTAANYSKFMKAYKANRKFQRLNNILGIGGSLASKGADELPSILQGNSEIQSVMRTSSGDILQFLSKGTIS